MVERLLSMQEAQGSIPWSSIFFCFFLFERSMQKKHRDRYFGPPHFFAFSCSKVQNKINVANFHVENIRKTMKRTSWGCSSSGRAPALHAGGTGIDTPLLHFFLQLTNFLLTTEDLDWAFLLTNRTKLNKTKVEEQGIDPCASCMRSRRSTI